MLGLIIVMINIVRKLNLQLPIFPTEAPSNHNQDVLGVEEGSVLKNSNSDYWFSDIAICGCCYPHMMHDALLLFFKLQTGLSLSFFYLCFDRMLIDLIHSKTGY
jgi:hypothetical protein